MPIQRFNLFICLLLMSGFANAQIEWPLLHATRSVKFTEAIVLQCNTSAPAEAGVRLKAFQSWKARNERQATALQEFNMKRIREEAPELSPAEIEIELDKELQRTILFTVSDDAAMCADLARWLDSAESEPRRQVIDLMLPPDLPAAPHAAPSEQAHNR